MRGMMQAVDDLNAFLDALMVDEDVLPEHCSANVWSAWAQGERNAETAAIAGVRDDVANAIARGWLRRSEEHRSIALRYLKAYQALLVRALADLGTDARFVELAETSAGRMFILLGGLSGLFGATSSFETASANNRIH